MWLASGAEEPVTCSLCSKVVDYDAFASHFQRCFAAKRRRAKRKLEKKYGGDVDYEAVERLFAPPPDVAPEPATEIYPGLWLGDVYAANDAKFLQERDIRSVLNASNDAPCDGALYRKLGIDSLCLKIQDRPAYPIALHFDVAVAFITRAVRASCPILVHCLAGMSRSATLVMAFLMREHGLSLFDSAAVVRSRRPCAYPNIGFWHALIFYEERLRGSSLPPEVLALHLSPAAVLQAGVSSFLSRASFLLEAGSGLDGTATDSLGRPIESGAASHGSGNFRAGADSLMARLVPPVTVAEPDL